MAPAPRLAPTARPVRIRSIARLWPMRRGRRTVPRSTSGTPNRRQNTPRVASRGRHPQVAPQRQLEPAGDGVPFDRGDRPAWPAACRVGPIGPSPASVTRLPSPAASALRSAPAQNVPPAPVSTATAHDGSASNAPNAVHAGRPRSDGRPRCGRSGRSMADDPHRAVVERPRSSLHRQGEAVADGKEHQLDPLIRSRVVVEARESPPPVPVGHPGRQRRRLAACCRRAAPRPIGRGAPAPTSSPRSRPCRRR